jgi:tetratricopeptide (TPR) repeat protein
VRFKKTTFLLGAGISLRSGLPDGATLLEKAFDLVINSGHILLNGSDLRELRRAIKELRLEILLERLGKEVPKDFLFSVFDSLKDAKPNFNHLSIIRLKPHSIVTTNQDLLLEAAARLLDVHCPIIHLHGRCDNKQSIITTISQYLAGLRPSVIAPFRESLREADVVVLGYSGRDRDVMPVLSEGAMKSITWLHHPKSKQSTELRRLKEKLRERVTIVVKDANSWLKEQLTKPVCSELKSIENSLSVPHLNSPERSHTNYLQLNLLEANLGVGRLLEHVGHYNVAFKLYQQLLRQVRRAAASEVSITQVQLAIARVQTFQYQFRRAYKKYIDIARNSRVQVAQRCQALADCAVVLRNSSNYSGARRVLDELDELLSSAPTANTFNKFKGEAATSRAGMLRLDGEASESIKLYLKADKYFRRAHDVDGWIDVSTWLADNYLTLGRFRDAYIYLQQAIDDADAYGRYFSKAWALFLYGELLGFRGDVRQGLTLIEQTGFGA